MRVPAAHEITLPGANLLMYFCQMRRTMRSLHSIRRDSKPAGTLAHVTMAFRVED